jgi:hypothetical protein
MANHEMQPVRLRTGTKDQDGRLIFIEGDLVAVIVLLADEIHEQDRGLWSMEADFRIAGPAPPLFNSPYEAVSWLLHQDARSPSNEESPAPRGGTGL